MSEPAITKRPRGKLLGTLKRSYMRCTTCDYEAESLDFGLVWWTHCTNEACGGHENGLLQHKRWLRPRPAKEARLKKGHHRRLYQLHLDFDANVQAAKKAGRRLVGVAR